MNGSGFYTHPHAIVETGEIGDGTRIWAFCHVLAGAMVGRNCNLGDHCFVEGGARVGDDVVVKNGVAIWRGVTIEDKAFIGPGVAFVNDRVPRAKIYRDHYDSTLVRVGASLGSNATILCGITVGRYALVGAGAVVTRDVPDFGLVVGNPARLRGFVCQCGERLTFASGAAVCDCARRYRQINQHVEEIS